MPGITRKDDMLEEQDRSRKESGLTNDVVSLTGKHVKIFPKGGTGPIVGRFRGSRQVAEDNNRWYYSIEVSPNVFALIHRDNVSYVVIAELGYCSDVLPMESEEVNKLFEA